MIENIFSMAKKVNEDFESLNAVVYCVGDILHEAPISQLGSDLLKKSIPDKFFQRNYDFKTFFNKIAESKGSFVFVTSVAKDKVYPNIPIYCATKGSLSNFVKSLALELAPYGARTVGVSPAVVDTDLFIGGVNTPLKKMHVLCGSENDKSRIKKSGAAAARNKGIRMSSGEYIAIFDADDVCLTDRFHKQYNYMENNKKYFLLGGGALRIDRKGNEVSLFTPLTNFTMFIKNFYKRIAFTIQQLCFEIIMVSFIVKNLSMLKIMIFI